MQRAPAELRRRIFGRRSHQSLQKRTPDEVYNQPQQQRNTAA
jgi:hypothetical protein